LGGPAAGRCNGGAINSKYASLVLDGTTATNNWGGWEDACQGGALYAEMSHIYIVNSNVSANGW
jgi:hypothetical protein